MNILELIPVIKSITGITEGMLASQYEANVKLDKIENIKFPIFIISEAIASTEVVQNDGSILTTYRPLIWFLNRCVLDENYEQKQIIKEGMSTIIRSLVVSLNKDKRVKHTMKYIEKFEIFRDVDTSYDRNLVGAGLYLELPHVDTSVRICSYPIV